MTINDYNARNDSLIRDAYNLLDSIDFQPVKAKMKAAGFSAREIEKARDAFALTKYALEFYAIEGVNKHAKGNVKTALTILA